MVRTFLVAIALCAFALVLLAQAMIRGGRSKWSECRYYLKVWHTVQTAARAEQGEYAIDPSEFGFSPERGNRYLYAWKPFGTFTHQRELRGVAGVLPDRRHEPVPLRAIPTIVTGGIRLGVFGHCPACVATAVCVGQLDDDAQYDVWSISTAERVDRDGVRIQPGTPYREQSDVD